MPAVIDRPLAEISGKNHQMGCAGPDLVVTSRTPIRLRGPRSRYRTHLVLVAVGPRLDAAGKRQRWQSSSAWRIAAPRHDISLGPMSPPQRLRLAQNSRNSVLSMPRIRS
jgi:hypothetical protein